jgi:hypothetical protein
VASWRRLWNLSWAERWLLAQAVALLPLTAVALWAVGFRRWQTLLSRLAPANAPLSPGGEGRVRGTEAAVLREGRAAARLVEAAARRGPYRASCLPRSLTLWWLLRRRGIDSELRIGVRKETGRLDAHAWVELRGEVLNDGADVRERFAAFEQPILCGEEMVR